MSSEVDIPARIGTTGWVGCLALFALNAFAQAPVADDADLHVRVIDVGYGNAIVAKMPGADESIWEEVDLAIKSDVLVAPHHGSISSSSPEFIASVAPE